MEGMLQSNDKRCDGEAEQDIPSFLLDSIATIKFFRRAGEWDLEVTTVRANDTSRNWVHNSIPQFLEAFSWGSIQSIVLNVKGANFSWNQQEDKNSLLDWNTFNSNVVEICYGFEATIKLELNWSEPDGKTGRCKIADAARLMFDKASATYTFTIWPNLFTDKVDIYERQSSFIFNSSPFPFQPAAQLNRSILTSSLKKWESLTGGVISSWESELVDGVWQYGFHENAYSR